MAEISHLLSPYQSGRTKIYETSGVIMQHAESDNYKQACVQYVWFECSLEI
jgi:hypothetical protein